MRDENEMLTSEIQEKNIENIKLNTENFNLKSTISDLSEVVV